MANTTKTLDSIAAIQTVIEKYKDLFTLNLDLKPVNSIEFLLDLLRIIGVPSTKILEMVSGLLVEDEWGNGFLNTVENSVKGILLANIKNMLTCSVSPLVNDELLDQYNHYQSGIQMNGVGVKLNIADIDPTGMLKITPTSKLGKNYYFDVDYPVNELYKSKDFNAFIWWVINKGDINDKDVKGKLMWDNRILVKGEENLPNFFNANTAEQIVTYNKTHNPKKKKIIQCSYTDVDYIGGEKLIFKLSSETYYKTRNVGTIAFNKTLPEFNFDFIYGLQLYDSKTLVTQLLSNILGVVDEAATKVDIKYSINDHIIKSQLSEIIKKVVAADDIEVNDCFYTFTNDEYDRLTADAELKYKNIYKYDGGTSNGVDINSYDILKPLDGITKTSTLQEKKTVIEQTITQVAGVMGGDTYGSTTDSLSFGVNVIENLVRGLTQSLTNTIFSPKVITLLAINAEIMGTNFPNNILEIFKNLSNLLVTIINGIKDIIVKWLFKVVMDFLEPLLLLFATKLNLESIRLYKQLLENLLSSCIIILDFGGKGDMNSLIDDVNYADIIPTQNVPNESIC